MKVNRERMSISMQKYMNLGGDSGVEGFEIGKDYIKVKFFTTPKIYMYSYESAGIEKVEHMKQYALCGQGLNEYINRYARFDYVK